MAVRIRTRLFLVVAALVAVSITASALLSRMVTLVELREVSAGARDFEPQPILDRAEREVAGRPIDDLSPALADIEATTEHMIAAIDATGRIVAASNPALAAAHVREWTPDGTFAGEIGRAGTQASVTVRGAPTRRVTLQNGSAAWLMMLPKPSDVVRETGATPVPLWAWTTLATSLVAVPLVFAASRRILRPITALTSAVAEMHRGSLDVRVPVHGRDELADLGLAFNGMASRLSENERLRQQMVSDVAHELRSPVTNLRCTLEAIQDGLVEPDPNAIRTLHDETLLLQRLITDLEDLASADAGQLTLHREEADLNAIVRRVTDAMQTQTGAAGIVLDLSPDLPAVTADRARLDQVVRNLLVNARMHTPADGRITVRSSVERDLVRVDVIDTGGGIAASHLGHVFDRFYRADSSRTRATGGAGLGLAIARQLVAAHGGTIEANSDGPGTGATFTVRLPAMS